MREIIVRQDGAVCELIRCKDCKWLDRDVTSIGTFLICNAVSNGGTKFFPEDDKWFCPKAERKRRCL